MKTKDFIETTSHFKDSELFKDILEKEVEVQLRSSDGLMMSNHFTCTRVGYKFNPVKAESGRLVIDIRVN